MHFRPYCHAKLALYWIARLYANWFCGRAEIRTANSLVQLQYLLQFYKALEQPNFITIQPRYRAWTIHKPFEGVGADIDIEVLWVESEQKLQYLSSQRMAPPSCLNLDDNGVIWFGNSKYGFQIGCKQWLFGRVNCPCPEQGRNPNSPLSSAIFAPILPTEPEEWRSCPNHLQEPCEWVDCDLEVLWVELKKILHLKVDCSDLGPVWDRGSSPYLSSWSMPLPSYSLCINFVRGCRCSAHASLQLQGSHAGGRRCFPSQSGSQACFPEAI